MLENKITILRRKLILSIIFGVVALGMAIIGWMRP
jgi:hypothetical protein